jgi:pimeloyl-ACP methyl ester carboxylesterase
VPIAEANGQRLYYEVHGEGEPLLCVMGLGGDHTAWILQVAEWSKTRRVVVFDNRDVGQSSYADGPYEVSDMAADALALADVLGLLSFDLVGISLGGAIAQEIALAAPGRVRTATIGVSYAASGNWGAHRAKVLGGIVRGMTREERVELVLMLVYSEIVFANPNFTDAARAAMLGNPHPQEPEAFIRQLEAGSRHDARSRLGELSLPVQVIGAMRDVMIPPQASPELAGLIPGARLTMLECGHLVNVEAAQEFNRLVLDFAAEHAGAPA